MAVTLSFGTFSLKSRDSSQTYGACLGVGMKSNSSAIKLDPTASQFFLLHTQLRLSLMAERYIQIFEISLQQINPGILLSNIASGLDGYQKRLSKNKKIVKFNIKYVRAK